MDNRTTRDAQVRQYAHEASLFDYVHVVVRHWRLVVLLCVPVVLATAVWSLVVTKTYRATTSIVPPFESLQGGDFGLARGVLGGADGAILRKAMNVTNIADIYVGILESRAVADAILDHFDLMAVYKQPQHRWRALGRLRDNTQIKVGKEGIVEISVVDTDPVRAAAIANAYVEELDRQNKRLSSGQATSKRLFLESRLQEIEEKFSRIQTIPAHEAQVQEMLYELLIRECELAKIEEARSMPTIQVLDEAAPPEHKYKPNRRQMVIQAGVGSLLLAVLLVFVLEYRANVRQDRATEAVRYTAGLMQPARAGERTGRDEMEEVVGAPGHGLGST